jgi:predicted secreted protein
VLVIVIVKLALRLGVRRTLAGSTIYNRHDMHTSCDARSVSATNTVQRLHLSANGRMVSVATLAGESGSLRSQCATQANHHLAASHSKLFRKHPGERAKQFAH